MTLQQTPAPDSYLLRWKGDELVITLTLDAPHKGRAVLRTNLGAASVRRQEIIEETEQGIVPLAKAWNDIPMKEKSPGTFECTVRLDEVGVFSAKACFFPAGTRTPVWPEGRNFHGSGPSVRSCAVSTRSWGRWVSRSCRPSRRSPCLSPTA